MRSKKTNAKMFFGGETVACMYVTGKVMCELERGERRRQRERGREGERERGRQRGEGGTGGSLKKIVAHLLFHLDHSTRFRCLPSPRSC